MFNLFQSCLIMFNPFFVKGGLFRICFVSQSLDPKKAGFQVKNDEWLNLPGPCPRYRAGGLVEGKVQQNSEDAMRASRPSRILERDKE